MSSLPAHPPAATRSRDGFRASILIGLCCFVIYNANLRSITAGDTYPARYLPFAIVQYHTVYFNPIENVASQGRGDGAYWMVRRPDGPIISLYPIVLPVLVAPLYVPAVGYLHVRGWTAARLDHVARLMEKLTASFLAALSASLLYLLLLRRAKPSIALLLTLAYAFGTTTWVISSQALWQHGLAELLVIGALLLLTGPCTAPRAIAAGLLLGLIAGNRPPDAILGAALGIYGLFWARSLLRAALLSVAAALPIVAVILYNFSTTGNAGGGYGLLGRVTFFRHDLLTGLAGLLISPTKGLLVFSPFLLFLLLAWRHLPRVGAERGLTLAMTVAVVLQILLYAKSDWRGGLSWGPRYMTDLLPFLMWMLVPVVAALRGAGRAVFLLLVGLSVAIQAVGAFMYLGSFDLAVYTADRGAEHDMRGAFLWRNSSLINSLHRGLAPRELAVNVRGSFDAIESGGQAISTVTAGEEAFVTGWALAGDTTPAQVALSIDGPQSIATTTFFDRADVRTTLGTASPAGWRIPLDTASLAPGEHRLTAFVWASANGEGHYLEDRKLIVRLPAGDTQRAVARIRQHQQAEGSWLTAYTSETRFHDPHPEMNTFLTALLVDLLDPVAAASGLEESVQRARRHLTGQIESSGLVRFHGLPDGPGIGTLGCVITPDTDNTALAWRIAPAPDRARLATALATIDRYRTAEGLYRTWLAPREAYQCLDPGSDPNPADIAIQMHLLLLLSDVRPPAGRALCQALGPVVDQDRIWVYYRKTPLVPILRLPDVRRAGCGLELPESRMHTGVAPQQIWVSVARILADASTPDPVQIQAMLRDLARNDFAYIRTNPPLLYHNDLTATVARYYWSEDVGYALWLRLHDRYDHPRNPRPRN